MARKEAEIIQHLNKQNYESCYGVSGGYYYASNRIELFRNKIEAEDIHGEKIEGMIKTLELFKSSNLKRHRKVKRAELRSELLNTGYQFYLPVTGDYYIGFSSELKPTTVNIGGVIYDYGMLLRALELFDSKNVKLSLIGIVDDEGQNREALRLKGGGLTYLLMQTIHD